MFLSYIDMWEILLVLIRALREGNWTFHLAKIKAVIPWKIVSEYDQEIPQSQTADNPMAP